MTEIEALKGGANFVCVAIVNFAENTVYDFRFLGQTLRLLPEKAILWKELNTLLIADLHLGKAAHFRRSGIAVPQSAANANLSRLQLILEREKPNRILILGDLFHADFNPEWDAFEAFIDGNPEISFELIPGNHDRHGGQTCLPKRKLIIHPEKLVMPPFSFTHHPEEQDELTTTKSTKAYNIAAHVHPAVRLEGIGKSSARLPCFYFGQFGGLLPAYGTLTGMHTIRPLQGDQVFVIANNEVIEV